jgi:hypothetical protein
LNSSAPYPLQEQKSAEVIENKGESKWEVQKSELKGTAHIENDRQFCPRHQYFNKPIMNSAAPWPLEFLVRRLLR